MKNRTRHMERFFFVVGWLMFPCFLMAQTMAQMTGGVEASSSRKTDDGRASLQAAQSAMDDDLLEVTIPQLENFYASHKYTVTQVVQWHLARIAKYNGIYRAVQTLDARGALVTAAAEDAEAAKSGNGLQRGPMWGVPILIKANTSVKGLVTTDGWEGYCIPGHELIAPQDATVVTKLRAAGAVTSITSNLAVVGTGTDTGNSIRMPSATSSVVGVFPTRGLVSIAGIAPLDWLLDNTGPIARDVTDATIALGVMAGEDPLDSRTAGSSAKAQAGPYTKYLQTDSLKGKRFGVPAFILNGTDTPFQGIPGLGADAAAGRIPLRPETRAAFMHAVEGLRAAGAPVVFDDSILPDSYTKMVNKIKSLPYIREGTENFLKQYGPAEYHSAGEYQKAVGAPLPAVIIGGPAAAGDAATPPAGLGQGW